MYTFLTGIVILIVGYFLWSRVAEKIFCPDSRVTPAIAERDNVDLTPLSDKRNMLIQLLNIAGIGPVIGVALGILFGPIVFILMPIGNILGGAIHDYFTGMISMRNHGKDLPQLISKFLGRKISFVFTVFLMLSIFLVVVTFINIPADFISLLIPLGGSVFFIAVVCILFYYILSSVFPIDKIVGKIYPFIGALIIIITGVVAVVLFTAHAADIPDIPLSLDGFLNSFDAHPSGQPLVPMLFVTIACGILSGFHATQSPIVSRTLTSEKSGRKVFYGMMAAEALNRLLTRHAPGVAREVLNTRFKIVQRKSTTPVATSVNLAEKAIRYVRANVMNNPSVDSVIEHLGVSRQLAYLRFRETSAKTLAKFILDARLNEVARRLQRTHRSIAEIAKTCSFDNLQHLSNAFKRRYGVTMSEYRAARQAKITPA